LLEITIPPGTRVLRVPKSIGVFGEENEVLLYKGGTFELTQVRDDYPIFTRQFRYIPRDLDYVHISESTYLFVDVNYNFLEFLDHASDYDIVHQFNQFLKRYDDNITTLFRCIRSDTEIRPNLKLFLGLMILYFDLRDQIGYVNCLIDLFGTVDPRLIGQLVYSIEYSMLPGWYKEGTNFVQMSVEQAVENIVVAASRNLIEKGMKDDHVLDILASAGWCLSHFVYNVDRFVNRVVQLI
jgi:hypothetical protein